MGQERALGWALELGRARLSQPPFQAHIDVFWKPNKYIAMSKGGANLRTPFPCISPKNIGEAVHSRGQFQYKRPPNHGSSE